MKRLITVAIITILLGLMAWGTGVMTYNEQYYLDGAQWRGSGNTSLDPIYLTIKETTDLLDSCISGTATGRGPSPAIWNNCPVLTYMTNPEAGTIYFNDFKTGVVVTNSKTAAAAAALGTLGDVTACTAATGGTTISTLVTDANGVLHLETTTNDEDCIISVLGAHNTAGMVVFESGRKVWMEARIDCNNISNSKYNAFFGFAEQGLVATTTLITASDAMADKDYVGFQRVFADGDKLDTVYNTESGATSPVTVGSDAVSIAAGVFTKIGLYCDGTTVYFFQDGVQLADSIALAATDFPDGEEMAFYVGLMSGHTDTGFIEIDWVRIAMEN